MNNFEELVIDCRKKKTNKNISNSAWTHALILFKNLFQAAIDNNNDVRIVTGTLNHLFYNDLVDIAKKCLSKQKIDLIVLDPDASLENNSFYDLVSNSDNGEIIQTKDASKIDSNHFIVVGDDKYRFELDHEQTSAQANFNSPSVGQPLKAFFDKMKSEIQEQQLIAG